jgi:hypothetical protein
MYSRILAQSDECLAFTEDSCSTAAYYCEAAGVGDVGGLWHSCHQVVSSFQLSAGLLAAYLWMGISC